MGLPSNMRANRRCNGFIVVAVLWILAALAALASVYAVYVANAATSISVRDDEIQREALVKSALELTAYKLLAAKEAKENARPTRGQYDFRLGAAYIAVEFCTEAARIDLNLASKDLLSGLFTALGATSDDAAQYADRIIGWRTSPNKDAPDKEASLYRAAGVSYEPRGAPFNHTEELGLVLGIPPEVVERAMPYVTVYSGNADVNILDAAPTVVAAIPGMTPERLDQFLSQPRSSNPDAAMISLGMGGSATARSDAIRITVRVRFDDGRRFASEVVILLGDGSVPYRVLSWRDDIDAREQPIRLTAGTRQ